MSTRSTFSCFGLVIHGLSLEEIMQSVHEALTHEHVVTVVTANPEILLEARQNPRYWNVLREAHLRIVDSVGLQLAGFFMGKRPKRVSGVEFAERLLQEAVRHNWKVALVGGDPGSADKAAWNIRHAYPALSIFAERGGLVQPDGQDDDAGADMRFRLTQFAPQVLLVGFGHPKQEMWIHRYLSEFPSVNIAVGVGGTIDYWSASKKRAPSIWQTLGFEWLWRLIQEPQRWKRILRAVVVFPLHVIRERIHDFVPL